MPETKALTKPDALVEKASRTKEYKELRLAKRIADLKILHENIKYNAAKMTALRKHVFKTDEQLTELGLSDSEKALVRGWELPKKSTPFAIESSAKLVESQVKGEAQAKASLINVENMTIRLPEKDTSDLPPTVIIDVEAQTK